MTSALVAGAVLTVGLVAVGLLVLRRVFDDLTRHLLRRVGTFRAETACDLNERVLVELALAADGGGQDRGDDVVVRRTERRDVIEHELGDGLVLVAVDLDLGAGHGVDELRDAVEGDEGLRLVGVAEDLRLLLLEIVRTDVREQAVEEDPPRAAGRGEEHRNVANVLLRVLDALLHVRVELAGLLHRGGDGLADRLLVEVEGADRSDHARVLDEVVRVLLDRGLDGQREEVLLTDGEDDEGGGELVRTGLVGLHGSLPFPSYYCEIERGHPVRGLFGIT